MMKCTDPDQWTAVPGYEASEEDVARYLAHLGTCAFHAALELREEQQLRGVVALGKSGAVGQNREPQEQETPAMRAGPDALEAIRRHVLIRTLSIRVNGAERARLNLVEKASVTMEVEKGNLVGVWQANLSEEAKDLYLTTYVLPLQGAPSDEKRISDIVLGGGQRISFVVEPRGEFMVRITVAYAETNVLRALGLFFARLQHRLAHRPREMRWNAALGLMAAFLALLAGIVLVALFWPRTGAPTQKANQAGAPQSSETPAPKAAPSPSMPSTANLNGEPLTTPSQRMPAPHIERKMRPAPSGDSLGSLAAVRRIYVDTSEGENKQQLRAALIAQLQASDKFIVVTSEREADAVLVSDLTRGASVRVRLLSRARKPLWFTAQPTAGNSPQDVGDVAARIVKALVDEAQNRAGGGLNSRP
jgi:hypothetical protein